MTPPDWPAADQAYQHHHAACPEGAQLWAQYNQAGNPPHFTWLRKRQRGRKP